MSSYRSTRISRMALPSERFVTFIQQQLDILIAEREHVIQTIDVATNQIMSKVNAWSNAGEVNHITYAQMNKRVQDVINFFMAKSAEISNLQTRENDSNLSTSSSATNKDPQKTKDDRARQEDIKASKARKRRKVRFNSPEGMTKGVTTVEETLLSLKRKMEQLQEKQEYFEKTLKDNSTRQENFKKEIEILTNANLKSQKKLKENLTTVEKTSLEFVNIDARVNRLEEENKSVNASMNEFKKQISSLRSSSNDVNVSTKDLRKRFESTNQHSNELSDRLDQLKISLNLLLSQYKEQFEHVCSVNKEKIDNCIGTVCQLIAKRLNPLEKLNETLNKKLNSSQKISKVENVETRMTKLADVVKEIELKSSPPNVGFNAKVYTEVTNTFSVVNVKEPGNNIITIGQLRSIPESNYGGHFHPSTGTFTAPLKGFYLINSSTSADDINARFVVHCILRRRSQRNESDDVVVSSVNGNQSVLRFIELEAGDKLFLKSISFDGSTNTRVWIKFSCCMIKV